MPIEFVCEGCQQRLRVPDTSAGKQAKCPNCAAILSVPGNVSIDPRANRSSDPFAAPPAPPFTEEDSPTSARNPYASPSNVPHYAHATSDGRLSVQNLDPGYAIESAWNLFKISPGILIGAYVVLTIFNVVLSLIGAVLQIVAEQVTGDPNAPLVILIVIFTNLFTNIVSLWLTLGLLRINLAVARHQPAEIGLLFSGGRYLLRYLLATIMFGFALGMGFLLLILPGIYVGMTYWSYPYFIIDRDSGVRDSLRLASVHAAGNRLNTLLLGFTSLGLSFLGFLTCGMGFLVVGPLIMLMFTIGYLMMTGQSFVQPRTS
jgi:hypothetical protein